MMNNSRGFEIRQQKCELREQYRQIRRALSRELRLAQDETICSLFLNSMTYRYADAILLYAPLPDEINTNPIADAALANGKIVAYPLCAPSDCSMTYHIVRNRSELCRGSYGIAEPSADAPLFDNAAGIHAVCIVPGLLFDTDGYRVGYGKGYYDRFLASFSGVRVGMAYTDFVLPRVPRGRFDLSVDFVVTEKGVRAVHAV